MTHREKRCILARMDWLNYHHLLYFWTVAREGSIAKAGEKLRLAQPTISGQLRALEESLGHKLFTKQGRGLALTEFGRLVYRYADEIFSIGKELTEAVKGRPSGRPVRFVVGISEAVPKLVAYRLLEPALRLPEPVRMVCREDKSERLLADLAVHDLDIVLTDAPASPAVKVRAYNHLLGECGVTFFASAELAARLRGKFPGSLDGAPMLMPSGEAAVRRGLDEWLDQKGLRPEVVGEFDDSALMKAFGQAGIGVFAAPSVIEAAVKRQYGVRVVGRAAEVRERFYAISVERRLKHPAVVAISETARHETFS
jgi:LysR family transcriptional activator of nhaA